MNRWHTESQGFVGTRWNAGPGGPAAAGDGYDIYATELNWKTGDSSQRWATSRNLFANPGFTSGKWIAYQNNGVTISFFPAVHGRNGSISYRLDWNGLSMIFTGDTKPNDFLLSAALSGPRPVDVLISEMVVDPDVWVTKQSGITDTSSPAYQAGMVNAEAVQVNSHTPQMAFGYILSQLAAQGRAPRLGIGTHFQAEDDTNEWAMTDIRAWYPGPVTIGFDLMAIDVSAARIQQRRASVSDYSWSAKWADPRQVNATFAPKYADPQQCNPYHPMGPLNQFDAYLLDAVIDPCRYDKSGFMCVQPYPTATCKLPTT
jgi:ribonuclease Z